MKKVSLLVVAALCAAGVAVAAPAVKRPSGRADIGLRSADPYLGAIVLDLATGTILFEDRADEPGYPASVVKLMDLLLIEEMIESGRLSLSNQVQVTAESSTIGGSQVWLKENEVFSVEELLAAMTIHSANDAATALALYTAGSKAAFVELMNRKAAELGMRSTRFHSVHGLPPAEGQEPDVSTARDLAMLGWAVLRHPDVLRYTSVANRPFRNGTVNLRNPDHLVGSYPGYDGLKTGYIKAGGFSIVSTAQRNGRRVLAVVLGSRDSKVRDAKAAELLSMGFVAADKIPLPPPPPVVSTNVVETNSVPVEEPAPVSGPLPVKGILIGVGALVLLGLVFAFWRFNRPQE